MTTRSWVSICWLIRGAALQLVTPLSPHSVLLYLLHSLTSLIRLLQLHSLFISSPSSSCVPIPIYCILISYIYPYLHSSFPISSPQPHSRLSFPPYLLPSFFFFPSILQNILLGSVGSAIFWQSTGNRWSDPRSFSAEMQNILQAAWRTWKKGEWKSERERRSGENCIVLSHTVHYLFSVFVW